MIMSMSAKGGSAFGGKTKDTMFLKRFITSVCIAATSFAGFALPASAAGITIVQNASNSGVVGSPYYGEFAASGGTAPYTYTVSAGVLPSGLASSMSAKGTLVVEGTPNKLGSFPFTVTAQDSSGLNMSTAYTLVIGDGKNASLTVSYPLEKAMLTRETFYPISWEAGNYVAPNPGAAATVTIILHSVMGDTNVAPLTLSTTAIENGYFPWFVPRDLSTSFENGAFVEVKINGTSVRGTSKVFYVNPRVTQSNPVFSFIYPTPGSVLRIGRTERLVWNSTGFDRALVSLRVYPIRPECAVTCDESLRLPISIQDNLTNANTYDWTLPADFPYSGVAYLEVASVDRSFSTKVGPVVIQKPATASSTNLNLFSPSGFESWQIGSVQTIKWDVAQQPDGYSLGLYLKNKNFGEGLIQYVHPVPNTGTFNLTIPNYVVLQNKQALQVNPGAYYFTLKLLSNNPCDAICDGSVKEQVVSTVSTPIPVIVYDSFENEGQVITKSKLLGYKNEPFTAVFQAAAGNASNFRITSGALPSGLSIKALRSGVSGFGEVSGKPLQSGLFTFRVSADKDSGETIYNDFTLAVLDGINGVVPTEITELAREASLSRFKAVKAGKLYYYISKDEQKVKLTAQYSKFKKGETTEIAAGDIDRYPDVQYVKLSGGKSVYKVENGARRLMTASQIRSIDASEIQVISAYAFYSLKLGKALK